MARTVPGPNVLVLSASRKVLLVRAFRAALARRGEGQVYAADVSPLAAALYEADGGRIVPRSDDPDFIDGLLDLCERDRIALVVPTRDEELPVLAAARGRFAAIGTLVLVSPPDAVDACRDKRRFADAVAAAGLLTPRTHAIDDPDRIPLPAFVKPRIGKGGRGAARASTRDELRAALEALGGDAVVQELVVAPEYTIDVFLDLEGVPISCVPRERMQVESGESVVARTVQDQRLGDETLKLCTSIGLVGHVTVQAFRSPDEVLFIEVNPRYGGAANLGFAAGARTPEYAVALAMGEPLAPRLGEYEAGLVMLRHADDRFLNERDLLHGG